MLTNSYIYLPGIGATTERKIWDSGIKSWDEFRENTIFLDTETTGLSPYYNEITMIGVHSSDGTKVFISGIDLEDFTQVLKGCKVIVTFNRARFDLPFIEHHLPGVSFDQLHIDMLNPLRRLGLTGGPKRIETELGLSKSDETTGLSGFDAVRL